MGTRESWIDEARGFGILFVMIGHLSMMPGFVVGEVYTFHIPLFFFLSGYLYNRNKYHGFGGMLLNKAKRMLIPYFFLGILLPCYEAFWLWRAGWSDKKKIFHPFVNYCLQNRYGTLWFLTCLFLTEILFYLILKISKENRWIVLGISILVALLGLFYYKNGGYPLPWNLDASLIAVLFFSFGYILKGMQKYTEKMINLDQYWIIVLLICAAVNVGFGYASLKVSGQYHLEMYYCQYGAPVYTFISAMAGIWFVLTLCRHLPIKCISYVGRNSLVYFILHQTICYDLFARFYARIPQFWSDTLDPWIKFTFIFGLSILSLTVVNEIVNRTKLRFVLGKKFNS